MSGTVDRRHGSLPNQRGHGRSAPSQNSGVQVVDADDRRVGVIPPAAVCNSQTGREIDVSPETVKAVDNFVVPSGYRREGSREKSFMYSLGVYVKPVDADDPKHKYFCLASASCRDKGKVVPCPKGDRSNVNTHHKKAHNYCGAQGVTKADKQKSKQTSIVKSLEASKNSGVGTNR